MAQPSCARAAERGDLEELKRLRAQVPPLPWDDMVAFHAAQGGHLDLLKWGRAQVPPCPWNEYTYVAAAKHGHLEVLEWLYDQACPYINVHIYHEAARAGRIDVLCWARDRGIVGTEKTCALAAEQGHLPVLQWLRAHGCPWRADTCALAAKNGHLHVLEWVRSCQPSCPWDDWTYRNATERGDIHILHWLYQQHAPWNEHMAKDAARQGHLEVLKFLKPLTPSSRWSSEQLCEITAARGHWDTLWWLLSGLPVTPSIQRLWLTEHGGRTERYQIRRQLGTHYGLQWEGHILHWLRAVEEGLEVVLGQVLCPDLVELIHGYC